MSVKFWDCNVGFRICSRLDYLWNLQKIIGYSYMSLSLTIHQDVGSVENCWFVELCGFWEDTCICLFIFYITVHRLYSMCRPHLFLFILYENVLMTFMKPILHICNIHQCIIGDRPNTIVAAKCMRKKAFVGDVVFCRAVPWFWSTVFVEKSKSVESSKSEISYLIKCLVWLKAVQQTHFQPRLATFFCKWVFLSHSPKQKWLFISFSS